MTANSGATPIAALVERARNGDSRAFESLYREHVGRVYGRCLRMARQANHAEDCTQQTFINAWQALATSQARSSFGTWLHRIAVNVVLARRPNPREEFAESAGFELEQSWMLDTPVEVGEIEAAIGTLPGRSNRRTHAAS
jgi:RNA polymerase sigma-70 factor (ECF subfamily)